MTTRPEEPIEELGGKCWSELEIIEHPTTGHLMFPDVLRQRGTDGKIRETKVRVRICRDLELASARGETRVLFKSIQSLDEDRDHDVFRELEQLVILSYAIRTYDAPHAQFARADELGSRYDSGCLEDILGRITALRRMLDPRLSNLSTDQLFEVIHRVARGSTILPLTGIAGFEQPSCIHFMACRAMESPTAQSWLQSRGILTPG